MSRNYEVLKRAWTKWNHSKKGYLANKNWQEKNRDVCRDKALKTYYKYRDRKLAERRSFRKTKKGKELCRKYRLRYVNKNRIKINAGKILRYSVDVGKLKRLPCEKCGILPTQAHHYDYSNPLDVLWLCRIHHKELHRKRG